MTRQVKPGRHWADAATVAKREAAMLSTGIGKFWRGQRGQSGYQTQYAQKLRQAITRAREHARKNGTEPRSILSHISRAKLAQTALLAAQHLVLTRRPDVLLASANLSEVTRTIFRDANTSFQRVQEGLAQDAMGSANGAVDILFSAIQGLLIGSCGGIDVLNRDLRPHYEHTHMSTGASVVTTSTSVSELARPQQAGHIADRSSRKLSSSSTRMYVVSLDGVEGADPRNEGRLRNMSADWNASCPNDPMDFVLCPGTNHPVRGRGLTISFTLCLDRAINDDADAV